MKSWSHTDEKIYEIANRFGDRLSSEFMEAVEKLSDAVYSEQILAKLASRVNADDIAASIEFDYNPEPHLKKLFTVSVNLKNREFAQLGGMTSYKYIDPLAQEWLKNWAAAEVTQISETTREAIAEIIRRGYADGKTYHEIARALRQQVGLTSRHVEFMRKTAENMMKKGFSQNEIDQYLYKYSQRAVRERARFIAINEISEATTHATYWSTKTAVSRRILSPERHIAFRIITKDDRVCPICLGLEGETRRLPDGTYASTGMSVAKVHPACRCVEGVMDITKTESKSSECKTCRIKSQIEAADIQETDSSIFVSAVPLVEGVFTGRGYPVLRSYDEFAQYARWLLGIPILVNHEPLTVEARRIGQIISVTPEPDKRRVKATIEFFKQDVTPRELESIRSGTPLNGSLHLECFVEEMPGTFNGISYSAVERGPYRFIEYSLVREGVVTPEDGGGINVESRAAEAAPKFTDKPWDGSASRFEDTDAYCAACLIDLNKPGEKKVQSLCKLPVKEPTGEYNVNAIRNALARISQVKNVPEDVLTQARDKLIRLAKQAGINVSEEGEKMDTVEVEDHNEIDVLRKQLAEANERIRELQERVELEKFRQLLKPNIRNDAEKLFESYRASPTDWLAENANKLVAASVEKSEAKGRVVVEAQSADLKTELRKIWKY